MSTFLYAMLTLSYYHSNIILDINCSKQTNSRAHGCNLRQKCTYFM